MQSNLPEKELRLYMQFAEQAANMSHAVRSKVGSVLILEDETIYVSWNGTPRGTDNACEVKQTVTDTVINEQVYVDSNGCRFVLVTKPNVIHAEAQVLEKANRSRKSTCNSTLIITHSPCVLCAEKIINAGVTHVVYKTEYRDTSGIDKLLDARIKVTQIK